MAARWLALNSVYDYLQTLADSVNATRVGNIISCQTHHLFIALNSISAQGSSKHNVQRFRIESNLNI